jgi:hypothetical protein
MIIGVGNFTKIKPEALLRDFNTYLNHELVYISEMSNYKGKGEIYLKIKDYISMEFGPPEINEKGVSPYPGYGNQNWIILTNHENAIRMEDDDRRVWLYRSRMKPQPTAYYTELGAFLDMGGAALVYGWLMRRDISHFEPGAIPPMTQAKTDMIEATTPAPVLRVLELFEQDKPLHGREFIVTAEVLNHTRDWHSRGESMILPHHITRALRKLGFEPIEGRHRIDGSEKTTVWTTIPNCKLEGVMLSQRVINDRKKKKPAKKTESEEDEQDQS